MSKAIEDAREYVRDTGKGLNLRQVARARALAKVEPGPKFEEAIRSTDSLGSIFLAEAIQELKAARAAEA